ncbi:extracellular solute-binding protein [Bacillus sp. FJAT-49732]|uniref:Extracellular solute-binding protein n=1 Tax=Lederbergia citrisecunda TaxID=2833583 RepID=A0A942TQN2_9BACI|nr:extracellular solute-binding protein [Lederbergia citrisecunda]MBS4201955.1 extracellular solute-binding protein [Lederbergia citrisecunda]
MKAKKLSFLLMLIFVLLLSACSGGKETGGNASDPVKEDDPPAKEEEPVEEEETYDLGGRVIRIVNHWDMTPQEGTETGDMAVARWHDIEEKYNVKIEWTVVPWEEKINQLTASILAQEPMGDIIGIDSNQTAQLVQQDYLYALDDLMDVSETKMNQAMKDLGIFNGKLYLFRNEVNESGGMFYNKTMFEQAGLPDPYELQEKGEWTWDAMLDAAKKLTTGSNFGMSGDPNLLAEYSIATNDAKILDTDSGEIVMDSPNAMEGLEFMASLINEHKVVKPNEGSTWDDPRQYFSEGLVGMTQGWVWEAEGRLEAPFDWGYVFWPKGPKASDYSTIVSNTGGMVIPKGVKDPEVVYKIWEDMQLWEIGQDGVIEWFENVLPNEGSIDTATQMLEKINVNYWSAYDLYDAFWGTFGSIGSGEESPSQAIAKVKSEAQARVDAFMGKE